MTLRFIGRRTPEPRNARSRAEAQSLSVPLWYAFDVGASAGSAHRGISAVGAGSSTAVCGNCSESVRCHARIRRLCDNPGCSVAAD
jgi:hypothetical protein